MDMSFTLPLSVLSVCLHGNISRYGLQSRSTNARVREVQLAGNAKVVGFVLVGIVLGRKQAAPVDTLPVPSLRHNIERWLRSPVFLATCRGNVW